MTTNVIVLTYNDVWCRTFDVKDVEVAKAEAVKARAKQPYFAWKLTCMTSDSAEAKQERAEDWVSDMVFDED